MPPACGRQRASSTAASDFHGTDGKPSWEEVALFCSARSTAWPHGITNSSTTWPPHRVRARADREAAQVSAQPVLQAWRENHYERAESTRRRFASSSRSSAPTPRRSSTARTNRRSAAVPDQPARREERGAEPVRDRRRRGDGEDRDRRRQRRAQRLHRGAHGAGGAPRQRSAARSRKRFGFLASSSIAMPTKARAATSPPSRALRSRPRRGIIISGSCSIAPIPAAQAKLIGDAIRASSGADQDTGVSRNATAWPARRTFRQRQSERAGAPQSSPPGSSSTPAGCGIPTSCWRRSRRPHRASQGRPRPDREW